MKVNVSKVFFSKTLMNGLKVLLLQRQLTKSNKTSWEFYLNLKHKTFNITGLQLITIILVHLRILLQFATALIPFQATLVHGLLVIFVSFNVFLSRLTVLMNDLRLKTFYCKSINSKKFITKSSTTIVVVRKIPTPTITTSANKLSTHYCVSSLSSAAAANAAAAAASVVVVFATSAILFKQETNSNHRNRHHRHCTYNNSNTSNSNKAFLHYTPRDPHLRIFLKTNKQILNRPQLQQHYQVNKSKKSDCCTTNGAANKNSLKIFSDLCNYGELIGGGGGAGCYRTGECITAGGASSSSSSVGDNNKNDNNNNTFSKQLSSGANLETIENNCDNLIKTTSDILIVATAGAAIVTNSADNIFIVSNLVAVSRKILQSIGILFR